jgi:hypothetical protein
MRQWLALGAIALSACTFEPIGASSGNAKDASVIEDLGVGRDVQLEDVIVVGMDVIIEADGGDAGEPPPDAGVITEQVFVPAGGGGFTRSPNFNAYLRVGGSSATQTATSSAHRVEFGPVLRGR